MYLSLSITLWSCWVCSFNYVNEKPLLTHNIPYNNTDLALKQSHSRSTTLKTLTLKTAIGQLLENIMKSDGSLSKIIYSLTRCLIFRNFS